MVTIARHINGIALNGLEYVLDEEGYAKEFTGKNEAETFLLVAGASKDDLEFFIIEEVKK